MDQMDSSGESSLTTTLSQLYAAFADADPLAAPPSPAGMGARALAAGFEAAGDEGRAQVLLRVLDDAIAAVEVAAMLAEAYARGSGVPASAADAGGDALAATYTAFVVTQPAYQALYHYRNALAARLVLEARAIPPAVAAAPATEEPLPPAH
jgi:hypothetical protein